MNKNVFISTFVCVMFASGYTGSSAIATQSNNPQLANNHLVAQNDRVRLNPNDNQTQDHLTRIIVFMGLIVTGGLCWYFFQSRQSTKPNFQHHSNYDTALLDRVSPKLRRQLLRLVNDPKTVNRLLMGIYKNNRDRSPNWLAEKAIYDLKRGR